MTADAWNALCSGDRIISRGYPGPLLIIEISILRALRWVRVRGTHGEFWIPEYRRGKFRRWKEGG